MDEFLNFPGKFIVHCDEVKGIKTSGAKNVIFRLTDGQHMVEGISYAQAEAEWKRACKAKADAGPCQAHKADAEVQAAMDDMLKSMDQTFKGMDSTFRSMGRTFKVVFGEKPNASRKG